jgi:hypothetical protein
MDYRVGDTVYCISEAVYPEHLTKHRIYVVKEAGKGSKADKVRITGDQQRLVWIPYLHFSKNRPPKIIEIRLDDPIEDPLESSIEVTVLFDEAPQGFLHIMTPRYLSGRILANQHGYSGQHTLFGKSMQRIRQSFGLRPTRWLIYRTRRALSPPLTGGWNSPQRVGKAWSLNPMTSLPTEKKVYSSQR